MEDKEAEELNDIFLPEEMAKEFENGLGNDEEFDELGDEE